MRNIGILHPGEMGAFVAASALRSGGILHWASAGRSGHSRSRAEQHGFLDAGTLAELCARCELILSVCPPANAEETAQAVMAAGYRGIYADLNAISPRRVQRIATALEASGIRFADGGIIGGPDWENGSTRLYLCGPAAGAVADYFHTGPLGVRVLPGEVGRASALKMCYAALTKGSTALLCAVLGAAEGLGVREELEAQWDEDQPGTAGAHRRRAQKVTAKAWRFAPEMEEIATTFTEAGLPGEFHAAAAEIYRRLGPFKESQTDPELDEVLSALCHLDEK